MCRERGKRVELHHIDENPGNNVEANLAVLCFDCHDDTQVRGGFGRKLNADVVIRYRDEWTRRVIQRRDAADRVAVQKMAGTPTVPNLVAESIPYSEARSDAILEYVESPPGLRLELRGKAKPIWDSGSTLEVVEACYDYIEALTAVLVRLGCNQSLPGAVGSP